MTTQPRLQGRLRNEIIVPFLLLALLMALLGSFLASLIIATSLEQPLEQHLRQSILLSGQSVVDYEQSLLDRMRLIALSGPNSEEQLPGLAQAVSAEQLPAINTIIGRATEYYGIAQLVVLNQRGVVIAESIDGPGLPALLGSSFAEQQEIAIVLSGQHQTLNGAPADKQSGILTPAADKVVQPLFFMAVPIQLASDNGDTQNQVGVLVAFEPLSTLVDTLQHHNTALYTMLYGASGQLLVSSAPDSAGAPQLDQETLALLGGEYSQQALRTITQDDRELMLGYAPLRVGQELEGFIGVGIQTTAALSGWEPTRNFILVLTVLLVLGVLTVGTLIARRITTPLMEITSAAEAVVAGDLSRRSTVHQHNELGTLASALNTMTDRVLDLYHVSRRLAGELDPAGVLRSTQQAVTRLDPQLDVGLMLYHPDDHCWYLWQCDQPQQRFGLPLEPDDLGDYATIVSARAIDELTPLRTSIHQLRWVLPLRTSQRTLGLLLLRGPDLEQPPHQSALVAIAAMAATALNNALLYSDIERQARETSAVLSSIGEGVVVLDPGGHIIQANMAAELLLQREQAALLGKTIAELQLPISGTEELLIAFPQNEVQLQVAQRSLRLIHTPLLSQGGSAEGDVLVLIDETAQREVQQAKADFISTISHELRTPLTPIMGYVDLLSQEDISGPLSETQQVFLQTIREHLKVLSSTISNIVLLTRIQSGVQKIQLTTLDPLPLLADAALPYKTQAEQKGLTLTLELPESLPAVYGEREYTMTVLSRLLDNAVRYTEAGTITVRAVARENVVQVDVQDTGIGIDQGDQQRIFESFNRGGTQRGLASAERGVGLGLAIAQMIVEAQNGTIWVESTPDLGSTFSFTLEVAHHETSTAPTEPLVAEAEPRQA